MMQVEIKESADGTPCLEFQHVLRDGRDSIGNQIHMLYMVEGSTIDDARELASLINQMVYCLSVSDIN